MKIKINSIQNKGNYGLESIVFEVLGACDTGRFILFSTTHNKVIHTFWFPDKRVQEGDLVILHTQAGEAWSDGTEKRIVHHLFWELDFAVWTESKNCPVLVEASDWTFQSVESKAA